MGYPTKVQVIKRKNSRQFYVNLPSALAGAMEFKKGEVVEWIIDDKGMLLLRRRTARRSGAALRGKGHGSLKSSRSFGSRRGGASARSARGRGPDRWL